MSKLGQAYLEATQDDMGTVEGTPTVAAELIRGLIKDNDLTMNEAATLGWSIHEIDTAANRLNAYGGDLSPISSDLDIIIAKLTKVAEKASRKA